MTDHAARVTAASFLLPAWTARRCTGLQRLATFVPHAGRRYAERRNFDLGPGDRSNVSTLSPWIRHRLVREDEVVSAVLARHASSSAAKFIDEVLWRTYWKGWLEMRPSVWQHYRTAVDAAVRELDRDHGLRQRWEEATTGRTGIACFDAWARELVDIGYLHNHTRMWFASIWIFTLALPWELGADFFLRHLLDGDPAANTLSWRWVAGLHTLGSTYLARPANIERFTDGRFGAVSGLSPTAMPLAAEPAPPPAPLPPAERLTDLEPFALLLGEDDCDPLSLGLTIPAIRAAAGIPSTNRRSPLPAGPLPARFSRAAIDDALDRVGSTAGCPVWSIGEAEPVTALIAWARAAGVTRVVTPYAPVGPAADWLATIREPLAAAGIRLVALRRDWDDVLWPAATKGFFQFKSAYPAALRRLGLA